GIVAPDIAQKLIARNDAFCILRKILQELEFLRRKRNGPPIPKRFHLYKVYGHITEVQLLYVRRAFGAPQQDPDTSQHLSRAEWLDDVIVRPQLKQQNPVQFIGYCGEDQNRHVLRLISY